MSNTTIELFVASLAVAAGATWLVVRYSDLHDHLFHDNDLGGPQKFHSHPVPRIGGLGALAGILAGAAVLWHIDRNASVLLLSLLACALPTAVAGFTEDITKNVSPRRRLIWTMVSAVVAVFWLDAIIDRLDAPWLDVAVGSIWVAAPLTVFAVTGVTNAVNIIDGFNGLASMCVVLMLAALAWVAFRVGDPTIGYASVIIIAATLGFFAWNFPRGLIFLGDGGAYLLGFLLAELGMLLIHRNHLVSPLFPLLLCIYPIFETVFSIYRKKMLRQMSPGQPDGLHLHMLVYRRFVSLPSARGNADVLKARNAATSPYLWAMCLLGVLPAMLFWDRTLLLLVLILVYGVVYTSVYWRIVRFRVPAPLVARH